MASTINTTYKRYNGIDWDTIYLKTTASQVIESTARRFLVPATHTINGKYFFTSTDTTGTAQGIVLYGTDIKVQNATDAPTIAEQIGSFHTSITDITTNYLKKSDAESTYYKRTDTVTDAEYAQKDGVGNVISSTYLNKTQAANTYLSKTDAESTYLKSSQRGVAGGVASLGTDGKVPSTQLPSYVDDVKEYAGQGNFPSEGETGIIYVDTTNNKTYRWGGTNYVEISASLALGTTSSTAYRGDLGAANAAAIAQLQSDLLNYLSLNGGEIKGAIYPTAPGAISLGTESRYWSTVYATTFNGNLTGTASQATGDGDGNTISTTYLKLSGGIVTGRVDFSTRPTFKASASSTVYHTHNIIFYGSTTPDGAQTGDIWLATA